MKILAIVPARGGSKRLPKKNVKLLAGKPLIYYVLQAAKKSKLISRVVVSTEDKEIATIAGKYDVGVIKRPKELAQDRSLTIDVIFHTLKVLAKRGYRPDVVLCLQPTSPLQTPEDIDKAIQMFLDNDNKSVISSHNDIANGAIYVSTPKILKETKSFYTGDVLNYNMPYERSVDINTIADFQFAEMIFKKKHSFIIAEAGINHNGEYRLAERLVDAAVEAGADAVKFQTFKGLERVKEYGLKKMEFRKLKEYCDKKGIMFLTTAHTFNMIDFVNTLVPIHKIASPFLTDKDFVLRVASKDKPILLSVGSTFHNDGMATEEEIAETLSWIPTADVTLLHCVSHYPLIDGKEERIKELGQFLKVVGLSDHTKNIKVQPYPVIEKHLMLDEKCIDAPVSLNPEEFKQMVQYIRENENIFSIV